MDGNGLFFIDSSATAVDKAPSDPILFDSLGNDVDADPPSSTSSSAAKPNSAVVDDFISVKKPVAPQLAVNQNRTESDPSRKLHHDIDVKNKIYFRSDPKSLVAPLSKNRGKETGDSSNVGAKSSSISSSSSKSKADLLVASLLDDNKGPGDSRLSQALSKSVITDDFGRQDSVPSSKQSRRDKKKAHLAAKESSKGAKWFDMKRAEMTDEEKRDLKILKMRKALDPKTFYKGDDMKGLPRFFQKGTVVESKAEFYSSRIPKKQRKQTLADELLADSKFVDYGSAKMEERKKFDEDRKKRMRQKKHLQRMTAKKKGKK